jgi:hypothetical protein
LRQNVCGCEWEDRLSEEHVPRLVKVNGVDLLELRGQQVGWRWRTCRHEDGFEHEVQDVTVELVVGAAGGDDLDGIEKAVLLALSPEEAFGLGSLLVAAANQAPFLFVPGDEEDGQSS